MKQFRRNLAMLAPAILLTALLASSVNSMAQINYQGRLTDKDGKALVDGPYDIQFSLWDSPSGGTRKWGPYASDSGNGTGHGPRASLVNGQFNVVIGNTDTGGASLTDALGDTPTPYLEVRVLPGSPITPRQAILASPRALRADVIPNVIPVSSGVQIKGHLRVAHSGLSSAVLESTGNNLDPVELLFTKQAGLNDGYQYGYIRLLPNRGLDFGNVNGSIMRLHLNARDTEFFGNVKISNGGRLSLSSPYSESSPAWIVQAGVPENPGTYSLALQPYVVGPANVGYAFRVANLGAPFDAVTITGAGKVGIGNNNPAETLDVSGRIRATGDVLADGSLFTKSEIFKIIGNTYYMLAGDLKADGDARWGVVPSDRRLKQDIAPIQDALGTLATLRPVSFRYTEQGMKHLTRKVEKRCRSASGTDADNQKVWAAEKAKAATPWIGLQYGFIAQELEKVFPDWVTTDDKGFKQIDLRQMTGVLVQGVNELQTRSEVQAAKIIELEARNAALEQQLDQQSATAAALQSRLARIEKALTALGVPAEPLTTASFRRP